MIMDITKTMQAIPIVTINWLVKEKANGRRPIIFPMPMNRNRENIYGKSLAP
jgi:hypothetical protein